MKNSSNKRLPRRAILSVTVATLCAAFALTPHPAFATETQAKRASNAHVRPLKKRFVRAKVFRASYKKLPSRLGNWRGRVRGNGKTHLFLRFIKNNKIVGKRLIGRVDLAREPNGVLFSYRGTVPKIPSLRWDIVAFSEKT